MRRVHCLFLSHHLVKQKRVNSFTLLKIPRMLTSIVSAFNDKVSYDFSKIARKHPACADSE